MRVAFFGSGSPSSAIALRELTQWHEVVVVVRPPSRDSWGQRLRNTLKRGPENGMIAVANDRHIPVITYGGPFASTVEARRPQLFAVASFPARISPEVIASAPRGVLNVHPSLLPHGRGPDPIFWAYYNNEPQTGSTVHWMNDDIDAGDIVLQQSMPIARGRPSRDLYYDLAVLGGQQLSSAITAIDEGSDTRRPQSEAAATYDPAPAKTEWRLPFDVWPAERTWHFLAGVGSMFGRFARDPSGAPFPVGPARSYATKSHGREPGTSERTATAIRLYCPDGVVEVESPP